MSKRGEKESVSQAEKVRSERHGAREWVCHWTALSGQWRKLCKSANPIVSSYDWEECGARGSWQSCRETNNYVCARSCVYVYVCVYARAFHAGEYEASLTYKWESVFRRFYCLVIIRNVAYATVRKAIKKWRTSELNHPRVYYFFF